MDNAHPEIVIIKRHGSHDDEGHGGAWKIAFADFMTAMMAFFLVLWIINATDKNTKVIIARYFNPVKLEDTAKAQKGIRDSVQGKVKGQTSDSEVDVEGPTDATQDKTKTDASTPGKSGADSNKGAHNGRGGRDGVKMADSSETGAASVADPTNPKPTLSESALFNDPYASLDEIAGKRAPSSTKPMGVGHGDPITSSGTMDSDAFRDPFQPIARAAGGDFLSDYQSDASRPRPDIADDGKDAAEKAAPVAAGPAVSNQPQTPIPPAAKPAPSAPGAPTNQIAKEKAATVAGQAATDQAPAQPTKPGTGPTNGTASQSSPAEEGHAAPPKPGAATQTPASEAARAGAKPGATVQQPSSKAEEAKAASAAAQANAQNNEVKQLRSDLLKEIGSPASIEPGPGLEVQSTDEGLLISLTDQFDFSMFAVGSAEPQARVVHIMEKIAQVLKSRTGAIVVRGHTDGRQYRSGTYDNWRLSSARAQMAYYMLVRGGLPEKRVERIEGYADRHLKIQNNPTAAENRRIEILLRPPKT
jgi:chemotaxis protein MotB